jgi:hypothetical protein
MMSPALALRYCGTLPCQCDAVTIRQLSQHLKARVYNILMTCGGGGACGARRWLIVVNCIWPSPLDVHLAVGRGHMQWTTSIVYSRVVEI